MKTLINSHKIMGGNHIEGVHIEGVEGGAVAIPLSEEELEQVNEELWHMLMNPEEESFSDVVSRFTSRTFSGRTSSVEEVVRMSRTAFVKHSGGIVGEYGNIYPLSLDFQLACDATVAYWVNGLDRISERLSLEFVKVGNLIERFE